jgi:protocatechuate 3,4-dioxygenase beta subunit
MPSARPLTTIDDDDKPVGRLLTRREILALFGVTGATAVAASLGSRVAAQDGSTSPDASALPADLPSCIVKPELTEGPYYVDTGLERSDIRSDPTTGASSEGLPLAITFLVSRIDGSACGAFEGALVDVWHCDAQGVYSGVQDPRFDTSDQAFLRGYQLTDATGAATFQTIYPGWYSGRAVHIHFKVRTDPDRDSGLEFTSQLFFDDAVSASVFADPPYQGTQDVTNDQDGIFGQGGDELLLDTQPAGDGLAAVFPIGVQVG